MQKYIIGLDLFPPNFKLVFAMFRKLNADKGQYRERIENNSDSKWL